MASYSAMRPDGVAVSPAIQTGSSERLAYLKKVYSLLSIGVFFFFATIALPLWGAQAGIPGLGHLFVLANTIFQGTFGLLIALGLIIGSSFVAHRIAMIPGWNLVGFFFMSFIWGFLTIPLVTYASMTTTGGVAFITPVLLQALGLTVLVFGSLTGYVFITRKDFSWMGGMLACGIGVIFGGIAIGIVGSLLGFDMSIFQIGLSILVLLVFSGYVLYDTSNILHRYSTDMVVPGALALMVDFIIIFRQILLLLVVSRD